MKFASLEAAFVKTLCLGATLTTLMVLTGVTMDPVNLPKLVVLSATAFPIALLAVFFNRNLFSKNIGFFLIVLGFILSMLVSTFASESTFGMSFYGIDGRYTGLFAYMSFSFLMIGAKSIKEFNSVRLVTYSFILCAVINLIYCGIVIVSGSDPIKWVNVYGKILGTFGNPNFISAFLGLFIVCSFALLISNEFKIISRVILALTSLLALFEIYKSSSIQGFFIVGIGLTVIGVFELKKLFKSNVVLNCCFGLISFAGLVIIGGLFGKGPLNSLFQVRTFEVRRAYWRAATEIIKDHPLFGVGISSFGDWYGRTRDVAALTVPGVDTTTNSAHNYFFDIAAGSGIVTLFFFLAIHFLVLYRIWFVLSNNVTFSQYFVAISAVWVGFSAQSLISINQIGLSIWWWIFSGLILGYGQWQSSIEKSNAGDNIGRNFKAKAQQKENLYLLVVSIGMIFGILSALPPYLADKNWRDASMSGNLEGIKNSVIQFPQSSPRFALTVKSLAQNNLLQDALDVSRLSVEFNPDDFRSWLFLAQLPNASKSEREFAFKEMMRLDPLNQNWYKYVDTEVVKSATSK